jgi:hypothetical protein
METNRLPNFFPRLSMGLPTTPITTVPSYGPKHVRKARCRLGVLFILYPLDIHFC